MKRTHIFILTSLFLILIGKSAGMEGNVSVGQGSPESRHFVLVVHGGAGDYSQISQEQIATRRAAMTKAMDVGYNILAHAGTSLDAVEKTLNLLEDSGAFDAGRGAYYTRDGIPELDSAIMDGRTLNAGAVAAVRHIANPISLARLVMEKTPHVLLVGDGAEQFAKSQGMNLMSPYYFYNEREWKRFQNLKTGEAKDKSARLTQNDVHGTVGAVALDQAGSLAAGTSTGGTTLKMPGRVGDSPLIGAGTYANNESCAISATGVGEFFIRNVVAADICARVKYLHVSLEQAATEVVMKELVAQHGDGGIIGLDLQGHVAMVFNSNGMMRGVVGTDGTITIKVFKE
ncbi:MAG TPA: isoaspartyl peptidase/L-asparaginase [Candidatus Acidoferrales bacterium]